MRRNLKLSIAGVIVMALLGVSVMVRSISDLSAKVAEIEGNGPQLTIEEVRGIAEEEIFKGRQESVDPGEMKAGVDDVNSKVSRLERRMSEIEGRLDLHRIY